MKQPCLWCHSPSSFLGQQTKNLVQEGNKSSDAVKELIKITEKGQFQATSYFPKAGNRKTFVSNGEEVLEHFDLASSSFSCGTESTCVPSTCWSRSPTELRAGAQFLPALAFRNISIKFGSVTYQALTGQRWIKLRSLSHCLFPGTCELHSRMAA